MGHFPLGIVSSQGVAPFTPDAVTFDGTNDYLTLNSALTGSSAGKQLTISLWVHPSSTQTGRVLVMKTADGDPRWLLRFNGSSSAWTVFAKNSSSTTICNIANTQTLNTGVWNHWLFSIDMASQSNTKAYYNDVSDTITFTTFTDENLALNADDVIIGAQNLSGDAKMNTDAAVLWYNEGWYDLDTESNRRLFISAAKKPIVPPTGLVYFNGDASVWNAGTNGGTAQDFTMNGSVADSSNEPVEI